MGQRIKSLSLRADKTYLRATGAFPKVRKATRYSSGAIATLPESGGRKPKDKK
jgi:hypothetical protein